MEAIWENQHDIFFLDPCRVQLFKNYAQSGLAVWTGLISALDDIGFEAKQDWHKEAAPLLQQGAASLLYC